MKKRRGRPKLWQEAVTTLRVRTPLSLREQIEAIALDEDLSTSSIVRAALRSFVAQKYGDVPADR